MINARHAVIDAWMRKIENRKREIIDSKLYHPDHAQRASELQSILEFIYDEIR